MTTFDDARRSALMQDLAAFITGKPVDLLPFEEVREKLHLRNLVDRGVQEVPLDRIVGTFGREREFNRAFFPRSESLRRRWQQMRVMVEGPGFPPVEVYQAGDVYFVVDGHHRVSVARAIGAKSIEARVKEFRSLVPLHAADSIEEVLIKSGLAEFLDVTGLPSSAGDDLALTTPDGYERLLEHICGHRYFRNLAEARAMTNEEAVQSWWSTVYQPMITMIRDSGVLDAFPGKTVGDLYLFIMDHLHYLRQRYGCVPPQQAVDEVKAARLAEPPVGLWKRLLARGK